MRTPSRPTSRARTDGARWSRRRTAAGPLGCIVNNASAFEPDTGLDFDADAALRQLGVNLIAPLSFARLLAQSAAPGDGIDRSRDPHPGPEGLQPEPRLLLLHVSKRRWSAPWPCRPRRWRPRCACAAWRRASSSPAGRRTPPTSRRPRAPTCCAGPSTPADVARTCVFLAGIARHHRHHPLRRQRPAPGAAGARHHVRRRRAASTRYQAMTTAALDPLLLICRRLFLRDYEVWINIGVHEFEKRAEQRVLINVDLYVPLAAVDAEGGRARRSGRLRLHPPHHRHAHVQGPHPPAGNAVRRRRWR